MPTIEKALEEELESLSHLLNPKPKKSQSSVITQKRRDPRKEEIKIPRKYEEVTAYINQLCRDAIAERRDPDETSSMKTVAKLKVHHRLQPVLTLLSTSRKHIPLSKPKGMACSRPRMMKSEAG
jgi:hypothetical protein